VTGRPARTGILGDTHAPALQVKIGSPEEARSMNVLVIDVGERA
jgi:hypothetical protein